MKADFAEIEKEAEMIDQMKERAVEQAKLDKEKQAEEEERQVGISSRVLFSSRSVINYNILSLFRASQ